MFVVSALSPDADACRRSAQLIIGGSILKLNDFDLQTYTNKAVIAIDQNMPEMQRKRMTCERVKSSMYRHPPDSTIPALLASIQGLRPYASSTTMQMAVPTRLPSGHDA